MFRLRDVRSILMYSRTANEFILDIACPSPTVLLTYNPLDLGAMAKERYRERTVGSGIMLLQLSTRWKASYTNPV